MTKRSGWETHFPVSLANTCDHMPKVCPLLYRWKIIRVELQGKKLIEEETNSAYKSPFILASSSFQGPETQI